MFANRNNNKNSVVTVDINTIRATAMNCTRLLINGLIKRI